MDYAVLISWLEAAMADLRLATDPLGAGKRIPPRCKECIESAEWELQQAIIAAREMAAGREPPPVPPYRRKE